MKKLFLLWPLFFLFSCATLPAIHPDSSPLRKPSLACPSPYLKEKSRLVHTIEIRAAGQTRNVVMGVTLVDPVFRSISCAVMTAEGLVLFEAESTPEALNVIRALPPFDAGQFAQNMVDDIKLIFLEPEGRMQAKGYLSSGERVCRYPGANGSRIDVIEKDSLKNEIKLYASSGALKRHILLDQSGKDVYRHIELSASETFDYKLVMTLVEVQPIDPD